MVSPPLFIATFNVSIVECNFRRRNLASRNLADWMKLTQITSFFLLFQAHRESTRKSDVMCARNSSAELWFDNMRRLNFVSASQRTQFVFSAELKTFNEVAVWKENSNFTPLSIFDFVLICFHRDEKRFNLQLHKNRNGEKNFSFLRSTKNRVNDLTREIKSFTYRASDFFSSSSSQSTRRRCRLA